MKNFEDLIFYILIYISIFLQSLLLFLNPSLPHQWDRYTNTTSTTQTSKRKSPKPPLWPVCCALTTHRRLFSSPLSRTLSRISANIFAVTRPLRRLSLSLSITRSICTLLEAWGGRGGEVKYGDIFKAKVWKIFLFSFFLCNFSSFSIMCS